jgi:repressor LexA
MDPNLTQRQQEILDYILGYHQENDYFPSLRETAAHFKISIGTVQTHLDYLKRKGALSWQKGRPRALQLNDYLKTEKSHLTTLIEDMVQVPILGRVSAGPGLLAEENVEDTLTLPRTFLRYGTGDVFALKVRGDSMIGVGIFEGDTVLVKIQNDALHNDLIVALLGEEAVVKRFYRQNNQILLISENPNYAPREVGSDFRILGKVVSLMRKY